MADHVVLHYTKPCEISKYIKILYPQYYGFGLFIRKLRAVSQSKAKCPKGCTRFGVSAVVSASPLNANPALSSSMQSRCGARSLGAERPSICFTAPKLSSMLSVEKAPLSMSKKGKWNIVMSKKIKCRWFWCHTVHIPDKSRLLYVSGNISNRLSRSPNGPVLIDDHEESTMTKKNPKVWCMYVCMYILYLYIYICIHYHIFIWSI